MSEPREDPSNEEDLGKLLKGLGEDDDDLEKLLGGLDNEDTSKKNPIWEGIKTFFLGVFTFVMAYLWGHPEHGKTYDGFDSFFWGAMHGALWFHNWIISFFEPLRLLKAPSSDWIYTIAWWCFCLSVTFSLFIIAIKLVFMLGVAFVMRKK